MWFIYALVTMLAWGAADLFYKRGADPEERHSHLWTSVAVGFVMGLHALYLLLTLEGSYDPRNMLVYLPVSAMYILSMTVGYFGLRYLQLSISSPIQNSSGAVTCILCLVVLGQAMDWISAVGVVLICAGIFFLGLMEYRKDKAETPITAENKKYSIGFVAFLMPILYCILDALGTFFDAYYLDDVEATPLLHVTEENFESVANISYEFTFLVPGLHQKGEARAETAGEPRHGRRAGDRRPGRLCLRDERAGRGCRTDDRSLQHRFPDLVADLS